MIRSKNGQASGHQSRHGNFNNYGNRKANDFKTQNDTSCGLDSDFENNFNDYLY